MFIFKELLTRELPNNNKNKKSFTDALKKNLPKPKPSTILLYPKENANLEVPIKDLLTEELKNPRCKIKTLKTIQKNGMAVVLQNDEERETFQETINQNPTLQDKISFKILAKRHLRAILYNVSNNDTEAEIQEDFHQIGIEENITTRFKFPQLGFGNTGAYFGKTQET
ncbi:hypothetical protein AVEN_272993-1 [Araneus ventricosus]|uniref:Uncharacterized protein n=1 Tax=Araneus ventricosus TaxID=182803 RepID=A0A4Y2EWB6_ARAVE|nr:hypothetical protein AVEN_272993-1 [Araneus ventricosus]